MAAYQQAQELATQEFGDMQAVYAPMKAQFQSIFDMGPSQEGFSDAEKQNLETGVIEGTARNYSQAARAVGGQLAAGGGGYMPSGAADQLKLDTALSAAQEKTGEEGQIKEASFQQGRQNWADASKGLLTIASGYNPLGFEEAATRSGTAAANTANQIAQEQNSWINAAIGAVGTIGGGLAGKKWG
jgi:hypothetical protein